MESFRHAPFRFVRRVPSSTITHVSASLPAIPHGRISRVRLAAVATFPEEPSHHCPRLKHSPAYSLELRGYILSSTANKVPLISSTASGLCFLCVPAIYREPLCAQKALPFCTAVSCTTSEFMTPPSSLLRAHPLR